MSNSRPSKWMRSTAFSIPLAVILSLAFSIPCLAGPPVAILDCSNSQAGVRFETDENSITIDGVEFPIGRSNVFVTQVGRRSFVIVSTALEIRVAVDLAAGTMVWHAKQTPDRRENRVATCVPQVVRAVVR